MLNQKLKMGIEKNKKFMLNMKRKMGTAKKKFHAWSETEDGYGKKIKLMLNLKHQRQDSDQQNSDFVQDNIIAFMHSLK